MGRIRNFFNKFRKKQTSSYILAKPQGRSLPSDIAMEIKSVIHKNQMPWLYRGSRYGVPRDFDPIELRRLSQSEIVQLCEGAIKEEIANTPWHLFENDTDTKNFMKMSPYQRNHDYLIKKTKKAQENQSIQKDINEINALFSNPNTSGIPFSALITMAIGDMLEIGDACWALSFLENDLMDDPNQLSQTGIPIPGARPAEIDCFDNLQYGKEIDDFGVLDGFWHFPKSVQGMGWGKPIFLHKDELAWFMLDPRSNRYYGYGNVEKCHSRLDLMLLTLSQERDIFTEGALSQGILSLIEWTPAQLEMFEKRFREEIKGHPEKLMYAEGKVEFVPFSFTYEQLQFLQRQLWYSKMVAGMFKLNLMVVGLQHESSNRATAWAEKMVAYEKGIAPLMKSLEYFINTQIIWKFYSPKISFAFDPIMTLDDRGRLTTILTQQIQGGMTTPNEAREDLGKDRSDTEGADDIILPSSGGAGGEIMDLNGFPISSEPEKELVKAIKYYGIEEEILEAIQKKT